MALRIVTGILAATFVPLGVVFTLIGLLADDVDRGSPEAFAYVGIPFLVAGIACAATFFVLWRRERARRARRRAGLRATAEIVSADVNWHVRVNGRPSMRLTVRFGDNTVTGTFLAGGSNRVAAGEPIDVLYDPGEPANFEPVAWS